MTIYNTRKKLEIAFRRWIGSMSPSKLFVSHLRERSIHIYRRHLEKKFILDMDWSNYCSIWQVDHIVPLCMFDVDNPEDIALAWSLDNIRPLSNLENKRRGASMESAWLTLLSHNPVDLVEYTALLAKIEPLMHRTYAELIVKRA